MRLLGRRPEPAALPGAPLVATASARLLRLDVMRRLDGLLQGDHLGYLPGPGSEPAEARTYLPGDDVRRIDWAVTARTGETAVRDAVAERELETTLLVDLTPSMAFGTERCEKREVALAVAAAFSQLAGGAGDRLGAVVLTDRVERVPPRAGREAGLALLHRLLQTPRVAEGTAGTPSLADGLAALAVPPRRRGLVVVVSDLLSPEAPVPTWAPALRRLALRHDIAVVEVIDPRELSLPDVGTLQLVDPESGRTLEVATTRAVRERFAAAAAARRAAHAAEVRRAGAGHVVVRTDRDWLPDLAHFLATRRRVRAAGRVR